MCWPNMPIPGPIQEGRCGLGLCIRSKRPGLIKEGKQTVESSQVHSPALSLHQAGDLGRGSRL